MRKRWDLRQGQLFTFPQEYVAWLARKGNLRKAKVGAIYFISAKRTKGLTCGDYPTWDRLVAEKIASSLLFAKKVTCMLHTKSFRARNLHHRNRAWSINLRLWKMKEGLSYTHYLLCHSQFDQLINLGRTSVVPLTLTTLSCARTAKWVPIVVDRPENQMRICPHRYSWLLTILPTPTFLSLHAHKKTKLF